MPNLIYPLTPENFWNLYASALNIAGNHSGVYNAYKQNKPWTRHIMEVTKKVIISVYENDGGHPRWKTQTQYFNIDMIGYLTNWEHPENNKKQHDWEIKIAYEHENNHQRWHDELCKLCHIVADLRIISSFHNFHAGPKIKDILQERIERLGNAKLNRVPDSSWLFIFGPRIHHKDKFRAFSIDSNFKIYEIQNSEEVVPKNWN